MIIEHRPYSQEEHWKSFWRAFYMQKRKNRIVEIPLTDEMIAEAKDFCQRIVAAKKKEKLHKKDGNYEWRRWFTGTLGEMALEKFLGVSFRDKTITVGSSYKHDVPDLSPIGLEVGVKSFRVGNFPLVNRSKFDLETKKRKKLYGQVFIGISEEKKTAYLLGIAFDEQLYVNEINRDNERYVKDTNALLRKTAFTYFDHLYTFGSLKKLQALTTRKNRLYPEDSQKIS